MASADSTALNLNTINPLIESTTEDTLIIRVNAVLGVLSAVFVKIEEENSSIITIDGGWGLSLIIDTCRAALEFAGQKGGAA